MDDYAYRAGGGSLRCLAAVGTRPVLCIQSRRGSHKPDHITRNVSSILFVSERSMIHDTSSQDHHRLRPTRSLYILDRC